MWLSVCLCVSDMMTSSALGTEYGVRNRSSHVDKCITLIRSAFFPQLRARYGLKEHPSSLARSGVHSVVQLVRRKRDNKLVIIKEIPVEEMTYEERQAALNEVNVSAAAPLCTQLRARAEVKSEPS